MAPVKKQNHFVFLTVAADGLAVVAGFLLTYLLRFVWGVIPKSHVPPLDVYAQALLVVVPVYIAMFRAYGLYQAHRHVRRIEEIFLVVKAVTFSIVILMAVTFFYRELTYSRVYLLLMWAVSVLTVSLARYFLIQWEYLRKRRKNEITRVLMIGGNRNARQIVRWARNNAHYGQEVIGVLVREPELVGKHFEGAPIVGVCAQWESFISHLKPEKVVLVDPAFTRVEITELVALCEEQWIEFKLAADFFGLMTRNVDVDYISTVPLLGFRALPLDDFWCRSLKRAFDLVVTSAIFLATFPVWLAVMAAIKLDDGGPLFYRQERIGRDLEGFEVFKFRTMRVDAEKETGPVWAKPNDARRTRIGYFLRRWNLDELPQLLNVLAGQMSLVGPRPERPHFIEKFRGQIPRYMTRHKVKSGLTGWAQVNGFRGSTSITERLKYDLYYMENWSLLFDIEILFMTFAAFRNAY